MPITHDDILASLRNVRDPDTGSDIVSLDRVRNIAWCDGHARVRIAAANPAAARTLKLAAEAAVRSLGPEIVELRVEVVPLTSTPPAEPRAQHAMPNLPPNPPAASNPLPGVRHVIAVGAGKGGVGKSTIAVNLAVGLARAGKAVGLLDADIYGPSLPTLLGLHGIVPETRGQNMIVPFEVHGVRAMTLGVLVEPEKPLIWRGPMAHGAFRQLATQTDWGDLDVLVIDLPPGTGDVPLTMSQLLPLAGAVVVCTPQRVAQDDARRAVRMFEQLNVPVLGVVENMSYFIGDDGKEYDIFGRGGAAAMAAEMDLPLLGTIPINTALRRRSDEGNPTGNFTDDPQLAAELSTMAAAVWTRLQSRRAAEPAPTLNIR